MLSEKSKVLNSVIRMLLLVRIFKDRGTYTSMLIYAEDPSGRMAIFAILGSVEGQRLWGLRTNWERNSLFTVYHVQV